MSKTVDTKDLLCQHHYIAGATWCGLPESAAVHTYPASSLSHPFQHESLQPKPTEATFVEVPDAAGMVYIRERMGDDAHTWAARSVRLLVALVDVKDAEIERLRAIETRAKERCTAYSDNLPIYRDKIAMARYILEGGEIA